MKKALFVLLMCAVPSMVLVTGVAVAHKGASGVVKTRMETMKNMAANMKLIAQMLRDQIAFDAGKMDQAAMAIANHSGTALTKLFPKDSLHPPSEARAEIWRQWPAFQTASEALKQAAEQFLKELRAAQAKIKKETNNPMVRGSFGKIDVNLLPPDDKEMKRLEAAFAAMGKSCKSCHEKFRLKKQ